MSTLEANAKIEKACIDAHAKMDKLGLPQFSEVKSKLEWVIASYNNDHNPVGLYEIGEMALEELKSYKKEKPRQVSKKLIEDLGNALKARKN